MIELSRNNATKLQLQNVEFRLGDIENIPITSNKADVVVSNCVLNLVPDKVKAFSEMYRILKPGGHFSVSDIVLSGTLPNEIIKEAEMYAGCVSGAIQKMIIYKSFSKMVLVILPLIKRKKLFCRMIFYRII